MKQLFVVVFCPCHGHKAKCSRWSATEWWGEDRETAYKDKRQDVQYFDSPEEGIEFYRDKVVGGPRVSRYNPGKGLFEGKYEGDPDPNITITGSHTICDECMEARDAERTSRGSV